MIKRKTVSVQTVKAKRTATTTMTISTSTVTTKNPQIQTENKATNENLSETPSGKSNINEKKNRRK